MQSEMLCARAAHGRLALTPNAWLSRVDLVSNIDVVVPILAHLGVRPTIAEIEDNVRRFFALARPHGKPPVSRTLLAKTGS